MISQNPKSVIMTLVKEELNQYCAHIVVYCDLYDVVPHAHTELT